ncbi:MAG: NERD domain-containing protein [Caldilineaceae bacterium]|nr:NERD domain-containing protein [Caldilineaceae bacterium]
MKVTTIKCGPAANESEEMAIAHLNQKLRSTPGDDEWILLTNLAFSVTHQHQSDEIDIVAIGPPGIRVIDVKHWNAQWIDSNRYPVEHEAERVTNKARKIGTTLRKIVPELGHVDGVFLLTQAPSKMKRFAGKKVRGVQYHTLTDWKGAIDFDSPHMLTLLQVKRLASALDPRSAVAVDGSLRRLAGYVNLELQTPKDERFHRIYKGIHFSSQDRIILHLYDLSATDAPNAETKARRESEALFRLQQHSWAPRIRDSFQEAPGYAGEMCFFTVVDPSAPSITERASDISWDATARLAFVRSAVRALGELHKAETGEDHLIHRNLTPETVLVRHDNSPILTGFERTKIPAEISVASTGIAFGKWKTAISPEVLTQGLGAADQRSDVYSLCASLNMLFQNAHDETSQGAAHILAKGLVKEPDSRAELQDLESSLALLLGESVPAPAIPPARFWAEDQEVIFGNHTYRIVTRLGSGGVGTAFKVEKIDPSTKEELGTYIAKVGHNEESGQRVLKSYNLTHSHLGRHPALSVIFEAAKEWRDNNFIALMSWVAGAPLRDYRGVIPLLAEDFQENREGLALRWLRTMCEALGVLHSNGLIHGDVSPSNMIVSGRDLVLTDYDFVARIGDQIRSPGAILYCPPSQLDQRLASPADDLYALAASFFHVIYDREPFQYGGARAKNRGLNWEGLDRKEYSILPRFFDKATNPDPEQRYETIADALAALAAEYDIETEAETDDEKPESLNGVQPSTSTQATVGTVERHKNEVSWLHSLLQSYPGSRWGNPETRGLDTEFASQTYVETKIEKALLRDIRTRSVRLVILCGNAGDGKTALLQHLAAELGLGQQLSSQRILEGRMEDGLVVRMNLDGSAAWKGRSADELLDEFLKPFQDGPPDDDVVHLLAINDGRLLEWIEKGEETRLTRELYAFLSGEPSDREFHIRFINLNQRSLVGGISPERNGIETDFLEHLLNQLYGGDKAPEIWAPCLSCSAHERCEVFRATRVFGPEGLGVGVPPTVRARARQRLFNALQAVHLRGETHITVRELRAALVYILFGVHFCRDYHEGRSSSPYWERAFSPQSAGRQGEVLRELIRLDPALETHSQIDRKLLRENQGMELESARRKAYFEWAEENLAGSPHALDLAQGRHLRLFQNLLLEKDQEEQAKLCARVCRGISCLEDLPPQAFERPDVVPLRITPRTPTDTAFWVEKPVDAFRLEADLPSEMEGLEWLHREAFLIYRRRDRIEERLRMGAELFHLLLELNDGYQMGDVSTDDTFAHLSIFVQRLVREDNREIFAWNPIKDETAYKVSAEIEGNKADVTQLLTIRQVIQGGQE